MNPLIVLLIVGILVAIILLSRESPQGEGLRKKYLEAMAKFVGSALEKSQLYDNSYQINFRYEGTEFSFEDIEEQAFQNRTYKGFLKAKTPIKLTLRFTEKSRTVTRSDVTALSNFVTVWAQDKGQVGLPKVLKDFHIYTNNSEMTRKLLEDDRIVKVFAKFKDVDSRGHPVMSLEITEGVVTIKFQPPGNLKPNLLDLQRNVPSLEDYLADLLLFVEKFKTFQDDA